MKYFIISVLMLFSTNAFCQKGKTVVHDDRNNITDSIYKVRTYRFSISNPAISVENMVVASDSATVKKKLFGSYSIKLHDSARRALLKVYNKSKLVDSVYLYARKHLQLPYVHMSGKANMDGVYTHLPYDLKDKGIVAQSMVGDDPENEGARYIVQSFTADIKIDGQYVYTEKITGPVFTERFNRKFQEGREKRTSRDSLILRYIVIKDELGNFYTVPRAALPYTIW